MVVSQHTFIWLKLKCEISLKDTYYQVPSETKSQVNYLECMLFNQPRQQYTTHVESSKLRALAACDSAACPKTSMTVEQMKQHKFFRQLHNSHFFSPRFMICSGNWAKQCLCASLIHKLRNIGIWTVQNFSFTPSLSKTGITIFLNCTIFYNKKYNMGPSSATATT